MSYTTSSAEGGLGRILDAVQSTVVGAPLPIVQMAAWDSIEEFCRRSCIWRQTVRWTLPVGVAAVDLNPVDDQTLAVWVWRVTGLVNYQIRPPAMLVDFGDLKTARTGTALVVCKPVQLNEFGLPSQIVDEWSETLRHGALFRLYMMPAKPWSEAKLGGYHRQQYYAGVFMAKETSRLVGDLPKPRLPYFARGSQHGHGVSNSFLSDSVAPADTNPETYPIPLNDDDADTDGGASFTEQPDEFGDVDGGQF